MRNSAIWIAVLVTGCIIGSIAGDAAAQAVFTDISASCGIQYANYAYSAWDVAVGDINNDGVNDMYCMSHEGGNDRFYSLLYRSNSSLSLTNVTSSAFGSITATGGGQGCLFVDLDADGDLDLITGSNDGVGSVLRNQGNGTFGWYEDFPWYYGQLTARELSAGDMDGDGDLDIIDGIHHQNMRIFKNDGTGTYSESELAWSGSEVPCGATLPIVADMDNDGDLDIVSQYMSQYGSCPVSRTITVDFWRNNGSGVFEWVSNTNGLTGGEEECCLLVGDYDNDADLDIIQLTYFTRGVNGLNRFYVNDGTGHFTEESSSRGLGTSTPYTDYWSKAISGDFDNDGDLDLFYRNGLWTNDGSGHFSYRELSGIAGRINGAADMDGDGDLDLVGARGFYEVSGDGFWVYRNEANNNSWLIVNVVDPPLNPFGVGAKVYIYDGNQLLGYRQVIDASAMQQPLEQHFGLGSASTVRVEVLFPDGTVTTRDNVAAGQEITISKSSNPVPPSTPTGLVAVNSEAGCADLSWNTPTVAERVDRYVLAWGTSSGAYTDSAVVSMSEITSQGGFSYYSHCPPDTGFYCYVLRAHNAYGFWSAYCAESCTNITIELTQPPSPPTNVTVTETDLGSALVSWSPVGDPQVSGYMVYFGAFSVEGGAASAYDDSLDADGSTSVPISGFTQGTYYFAVKSYTGAGEHSAYSAEQSLVMEGIDESPPVITPTSPADGATDVAVNASIFFEITDDKAGVDMNSVTVTVDGTPVTSLQFYGDPGDYTVVADPPEDFQSPATIDVQVSASDLASTPNDAGQSWSFQTAGTAITDTEAPVFSGLQPTRGATGVAADARIRLTVSDALSGIDVNSIAFYVNDTEVEFTRQGDPFSLTLTYENVDGFTPGTEVAVRVAACDLASTPNCGELTDYTFTVAMGGQASTAAKEGEVIPNGYWANDPARPMEVRNLPLSWTVRIFDTAGRLVREYTNNSAGGQNWVWDFTNDHGQRVARAMYLVRVTAPDGSVQQSGRFLVQTEL
jgi:hypothetical protein